MGIETVIAGLSALVGVVGGIAQASAVKAAASQEREARNIQSAQQQTAGAESRRQRIREERIRRAQIIATSENQGTGSSSGQIGAVGALSTNLSGLIGSSLGESKANQAISNRLQSASNSTSQANTIGAWTNTIQQGLGGFQSIFQKE